MLATSKNALRGFGGILEILLPRRSEGKNIRDIIIKSDKERMDEAWGKVGEDLKRAMTEYSERK